MEQAYPKMTKAQARIFWNALSVDEKRNFNMMMEKMGKKELMITKVNVDDREKISSIILETKEKPSQPSEPFYKLFRQAD